MKKWIWITMILTCVFVFAACADTSNKPTPENESEGMPDTEVNVENNSEPAEAEEAEGAQEAVPDELMPVTVKLKDNNGESVGTAELVEEEDALRVMVDVQQFDGRYSRFSFPRKRSM